MTPRQKLIASIGASAAAIVTAFVAQHEGLRLWAYRDPVGVLTACYGHTGPDVQPGQTYTREQCRDLLAQDLARHAQALACIHRPLTDGQKAAFVSFAYNVGPQAFCGSSLVRKANAGDMAGACAELDKWVYAKGQRLPGLVKRRAAERAMCEGSAP
nr:lysozyme [uncultured Ottowia sp.]